MKKSPNTTTAPTGQIAPFGLRLLPDLREKIEAAAKESGRSMNAEIVARLQVSFEPASLPVVTINLLADENTRATEIKAALDQLKHCLPPDQPLVLDITTK